MPFQIVRNDITHMRVDAVVNAANERLQAGSGVCGAIFAGAGDLDLQAACDTIGHCDTGKAVVTPGFRLPAKHVIHTVGPIWRGGHHGEEQALRSCYRSALALALQLGDASIAFPLISSGAFGYPKSQAIDIAQQEIRTFLEHHEMDVYLTIYDAEALHFVTERFARVGRFIDDVYVRTSPFTRERPTEDAYAHLPVQEDMAQSSPLGNAKASELPSPSQAARLGSPAADDTVSWMPAAPSQAAGKTPGSSAKRPQRVGTGFLRRLLSNLDESFSTTLLRMIDKRGLKDSDVYKRANMSRQHFSKIRSNPAYQPKKQTVLALAVALELPLDQTRLLLERAGFALTHADKRDVIVEYFIREGIYDIYEINLALYAYDLPLLG